MTDGSAPLVSILLPTYNRRDYLRAALASALAQSFRDFEIIVHDNASPADPVDVVESFGDPRVRYYRNPRNMGTTGNVLAAYARARGKYVAILGDDDLWHAEFLATLVAPLEADDSLALAFCDHSIIDAAGHHDDVMTEKVTKRFGRHLLREGVYRPFDEIAVIYRAICVVSAALLRRTDVDWSSIPVELGFSLDLVLAYLAARTGKGCYYVPRRLAHYRYHATSIGSSLRRADQRLANARDAMWYWDQLLRDRTLPRNKRYFEMKIGYNALVIVLGLWRCGEWRQALNQLRQYRDEGLLPPRIFLYHGVYALRLHRVRA